MWGAPVDSLKFSEVIVPAPNLWRPDGDKTNGNMPTCRVPCNYPGQKVTFHVEEGSNPMYLAVLVEFEDGDGDVVQVDLMEANSRSWAPMRESWGSIWRMDSNHRLQAPFSLRVTNESGRKLVASRVIPANWAPNNYYRSIIQY